MFYISRFSLKVVVVSLCQVSKTNRSKYLVLITISPFFSSTGCSPIIYLLSTTLFYPLWHKKFFNQRLFHFAGMISVDRKGRSRLVDHPGSPSNNQKTFPYPLRRPR